MITPDAWQNFLAHGGTWDLSRSVKLRLSGPDALRYLNGQVSNDVKRLARGDSLPACVCTHKGKLEALVMISRAPDDAFYITADEALRDFLPLRMEKYLIADNAVLEDITDQFDLAHSFGNTPPVSVPGAMSFSANRLKAPGTDVWLSPGSAANVQFTDPALIELFRIERGIPAWEPELSGVLPPEARLEESAIDYHKGCYTGQEVISRLRSVGQVNRRLERLIAPGSEPLEAGWQLFSLTDGGARTPAGNLTSVARHPVLEKWIALGFVKRSASGAALVAVSGADAVAVPVQIRKTLDDQEP